MSRMSKEVPTRDLRPFVLPSIAHAQQPMPATPTRVYWRRQLVGQTIPVRQRRHPPPFQPRAGLRPLQLQQAGSDVTQRDRKDIRYSKKTGSPMNAVCHVHDKSAPSGTATQTFPSATPPADSSPASVNGFGMTPHESLLGDVDRGDAIAFVLGIVGVRLSNKNKGTKTDRQLPCG